MSTSSSQYDSVTFKQMNKLHFYSYGTLFFLGVRICVYPAATVKTRQQTANAGEVLGTFRYFKHIIRTEGVLGLYRGFPVTALGAVPTQMIYLTVLELSKLNTLNFLSAYSKISPERTLIISSLVAGGMASFSSQFVQCPIDVVSQRLMIQKTPISTLSLISKIYFSEGIIGFYRGFFASILTYVPNSAIWWGTFSAVKRIGIMGLDRPHNTSKVSQSSSAINVEDSTKSLHYSQQSNPRSHQPAYWKFLLMSSCSGALAGITSAVLTNPMDVVKTRLQTNIRNSEPQHDRRIHLGRKRPIGWIKLIMDEFILLYKEEGLKGFQRGVGARAVNTVPVSMLMVTSYELVRRLSTI